VNCEAVGWIRRNVWAMTGYAHHLEKSAANCRNTSIHRLVSQYVNLWGFGSRRLRKRFS
jgi:hypothetical protein